MQEKKKYIIPDALIVAFDMADIITYSDGSEDPDRGWDQYPDVERW